MAAPPSSPPAPSRPPVSGLAPPSREGRGEGGGKGFTLRGGLATHAHRRTGPRRPHFLAFPPPPPRRYPVHPGHLPSPLGAAVAAAAWLVAAPPQGQVRRGSLSGRRRCPAPGPGLPLAPLRSLRCCSRRAEERAESLQARAQGEWFTVTISSLLSHPSRASAPAPFWRRS